MIPLAVLADRARRVALAAMFAVAAVVVGYVYFVTLYMQKVLGFSPLRAGLGLLPATLTVLVTSTWLARRLVARFGARLVLAAGLTSIGLGQAWLTQLPASGSYLVNVLPGLLLTSFGMGLLFPTAAVLATAGIAPGDRGLAGGLLAASQQVGMAVGLAVLATVAAARTRAAAGPAAAALVSGYRLSYLVGAAMVACALAGVLLLLPANRTGTAQKLRDNSKKRGAQQASPSGRQVRYNLSRWPGAVAGHRVPGSRQDGRAALTAGSAGGDAVRFRRCAPALFRNPATTLLSGALGGFFPIG